MSHARLLLLDLPDPPSLPIDRGTRVREVGRGLLPLATPIGLRPDEHAPTRADSRRLISRVLEQGQRRFDLIVLHEQLHAGHSAFHARTYSDDGRGYSGGLQLEPRQIGLDRGRIALDDFHRWPLLHDPPIGHASRRDALLQPPIYPQASGDPGSLPAQGRGEPTPRSRALPCDQGLALRASLHSQSSIRFLLLLCGALFHQALGGFLLCIFLCVHCLAHNGLLGLEGTIGILRQSEQIRVIGNSANPEQAARRRGLSTALAYPRRFAPGAPRLELGTPCTTYSLVCCLTLLDSSASRLAQPLLPVAQGADVHVQQRCELRLAQADF